MTSTSKTVSPKGIGAGLFGRSIKQRKSPFATGTHLHPALALKHSPLAQASLQPPVVQAAEARRACLGRGSQAGQPKPSVIEHHARPVYRGLAQHEQPQCPTYIMVGPGDQSRLSAASLEQKRLSRTNAPVSTDVKPRTRSVASSSASSTAASSVAGSQASRATKTPADLHHIFHRTLPKDFPRPFYSFVASCHHILDKIEEHIVPDSMFDMDLRHITGSRARNGRVTEISYSWGPIYRNWKIRELEKKHEAWYDKIQQDVLRLYNDWHHMQYPCQHTDQHWAEATTDLMDPSKSRMETFLNHKCVLQVVDTGAQPQFVLWTTAHIRRLAEKKHGGIALPRQGIVVKGSKRQGRITVDVKETLEREQKKSLEMERYNMISNAPPLPSMHRHFNLKVPALIEDYLHPSHGRHVTPTVEERRQSRLAIEQEPREHNLQDEFGGRHRNASRVRRPQLVSSQTTPYSSYRG